MGKYRARYSRTLRPWPNLQVKLEIAMLMTLGYIGSRPLAQGRCGLGAMMSGYKQTWRTATIGWLSWTYW